MSVIGGELLDVVRNLAKGLYKSGDEVQNIGIVAYKGRLLSIEGPNEDNEFNLEIACRDAETGGIVIAVQKVRLSSHWATTEMPTGIPIPQDDRRYLELEEYLRGIPKDD